MANSEKPKKQRLTPEEYFLGEPPKAKTFAELYVDASREILIPAPSIPVDDFSLFTRLTGGFRSNEFTILCGATGSGKTQFIANLSSNFVKQEVPHFVASVETGPTDFAKRVMSVMADEDWNTGEPVEPDKIESFKQKYIDLIKKEHLRVSLYDDRFSVEQLMSDIYSMVINYGSKIAIIDNLNFFLEVTSANQQIQEMDRVVHELIIFCKRIDVHLIMIMHPRKTENGRIEHEDHIKGSSTAVQEAHNVFLWNRLKQPEKNEDPPCPTDRELKIVKMRRRGLGVGKSIRFVSKNGVKLEEAKLDGSSDRKPNPASSSAGRASFYSAGIRSNSGKINL